MTRNGKSYTASKKHTHSDPPKKPTRQLTFLHTGQTGHQYG